MVVHEKGPTDESTTAASSGSVPVSGCTMGPPSVANFAGAGPSSSEEQATASMPAAPSATATARSASLRRGSIGQYRRMKMLSKTACIDPLPPVLKVPIRSSASPTLPMLWFVLLSTLMPSTVISRA